VVRHGVEQGPALRQGPIFEVAGRQYDWSDVEEAAVFWGDWQRLEQATREGLACQQRLELLDVDLGADEVREAAKHFRYSRNLLAADELEEWLGRWGMTTSEWLGSVRRSLLRSKWSNELEAVEKRHPVDAASVAAVIRIEGICSGAFEHVARKLANRAAAAAAIGIVAEGPPALDEAFDRFKAEEVSAGAVEKELERKQLDWIRIEGEALTLGEEDVAKEAALSIRDGMSLEEVAKQAGVESQAISRYLDEAETELQPRLVSAEEGTIVGPVQIGEEFVLLRVQAKRLPVSSDADVVNRAEAALLNRAVEREVHQRVRWLERL
jgi:hypothetical protein